MRNPNEFAIGMVVPKMTTTGRVVAAVLPYVTVYENILIESTCQGFAPIHDADQGLSATTRLEFHKRACRIPPLMGIGGILPNACSLT